MQYISRIFAKEAPFTHLQLHMEKVVAALAKLLEMFNELNETNTENLEQLAQEVSELEHDADLVKNDIRRSFTNRFLLSFDRSNFLEILSLQDNLADTAEDIAGILIIKEFTPVPEVMKELRQYIEKNLETVWDLKDIVFALDQLQEASFGGRFAEEIKQKVDQTAYKEHESDVMRRKIMKKIFSLADRLSTADFYLWMHLIDHICQLSHFAEKEALRIAMMLDMK